MINELVNLGSLLELMNHDPIRTIAGMDLVDRTRIPIVPHRITGLRYKAVLIFNYNTQFAAAGRLRDIE